MSEQVLLWIGYFASATIALSMTMSSIVKFRWVNLIGAATFAIYDFLIGAFPVMLLNGIIVLVDIYYLYRIYSKENLFDTLEIRGDNKYLMKFLDFHQKDINIFFPDFKYNPELNTVSFFVLRNVTVAGLFLAHREGDTLKVGLDYVVPEYRDYKNGKYVYGTLRGTFKEAGFKKIVAEDVSESHGKYLEKLDFKEVSKGVYTKEL
jgi:hypothetical protein